MKKIVVLFSGGLDSVVMYEMAKRTGAEVTPVYFDIGHEYAWKEKQQLPPECEVLDMQWFQASGHGKEGNAMNNIFIPGRNMVFATIAASKYLPDEIWMGALMGEIHDQATDKNEVFRSIMNLTMDYVLSPFGRVELKYPFVERNMGKFEITKMGVEEFGLKDKILSSSSCMSGEEGNCGKCGVCLRRAGIFEQLGLKEEYNVNPWTAPENQSMIRELVRADIIGDYSHYDIFRIREIVPAIKKITGLGSRQLYTLMRDGKDTAWYWMKP